MDIWSDILNIYIYMPLIFKWNDFFRSQFNNKIFPTHTVDLFVFVIIYLFYFSYHPPHNYNNSRCEYVYIFPVPRIVATASSIWENNNIFLF